MMESSMEISSTSVDGLNFTSRFEKGVLSGAFGTPEHKAPIHETDGSPTGVDALYVPEASVELSSRSGLLEQLMEDNGDDSDSCGSEYTYDEEEEERDIASNWSTEIDQLVSCRSSFQTVTCLRRIANILGDIAEEDRLRFCKADFRQAVDALRDEDYHWFDDLSSEVVHIHMTYFDENLFNKLPEVIIQEIFLWIPVGQFAPVVEVCTEWHNLGTHDIVWKTYYKRKFLTYNPGTMPKMDIELGFRYLFQIRLQTPQCGDRVEVAWRGKFRLEANEMYQGLAWWVAQVVDVHEEQDRYKIRYLGWDEHWDDWIPRNRLRWVVEPNVVEKVRAGDHVELWCIGSNVPGAWLSTRIKKVKKGRFILENEVISEQGPIAVRRDRLRLVSRGKSRDERRLEEQRRTEQRRTERSIEQARHSDRKDVDAAAAASSPSRRLSFSALGSMGRAISRRLSIGSSNNEDDVRWEAPHSPSQEHRRGSESTVASNRDRNEHDDSHRRRSQRESDTARYDGVFSGSGGNGSGVRVVRHSRAREVRVGNDYSSYDRGRRDNSRGGHRHSEGRDRGRDGGRDWDRGSERDRERPRDAGRTESEAHPRTPPRGRQSPRVSDRAGRRSVVPLRSQTTSAVDGAMEWTVRSSRGSRRDSCTVM